jgi:CcmD family protein
VNLYLFAGYAVFWSILLGYLVVLHRRQTRFNRELRDLTEKLEEE